MTIEIVSIRTKRGERTKGAPVGDKWAAISIGTILIWEIKTEDQNTKARIAANQIVDVTGNAKGAMPNRFSAIKPKKTLRNSALPSLIPTLFIIWANFLTRAVDKGEEGANSTRKGSDHMRLFPWSTLEKISANNSNASALLVGRCRKPADSLPISKPKSSKQRKCFVFN